MSAHVQPASARDIHALRKAREALQTREPNLRIRDAADALGVSEAELVALGCGTTATRLRPEWPSLVQALPGLGRCMALTRNAWAVHEKRGEYGNIDLGEAHGLVLNGAIDLRLFLNSWHIAFAVRDPVKTGVRRSIQIFDAHGVAVHKVYPESSAGVDAFEFLAARLAADSQDPALTVLSPASPKADAPDARVDVAGLRAGWSAMQDTHEFHGLLHRFGVGRQQALRLAGAEFAAPLRPDALDTVLHSAAQSGLPLMVFVSSPGVVQIHSGPVQTIRVMGDWLNVLDADFNLHVKRDGLASAWIVHKPTADGIITSLEVFSVTGELTTMLFGVRKPGNAENPQWRALAEGLPRAEVA